MYRMGRGWLSGMRRLALILTLALVAVACTVDNESGGTTEPPAVDNAQIDTPSTTTTAPPSLAVLFGEAPEVPDRPLTEEATAAVDAIFDRLDRPMAGSQFAAFGETGDARLVWLIADLLRFSTAPSVNESAVAAVSELTGVEFSGPVPWVGISDHLIAWDLPAFPGYESYKEHLYTFIDPRWDFVFAEPNDIDYRLLSWGGVPPDDRPFGDAQPCPLGCIPALDEPSVTPASEGDWYPGDRIVFGVEINGEARAYPKNIMEVHEMVNDTLGGRDFGLPYCTLCGSAQLFFTDDTEGYERPILRTSGLLSRSNKVMYDLVTRSVFDTFTGRAISGPLFETGITLPQGSVVVSTWGDWKAAHPGTTIVAQDGGIGRNYSLDPLGGRDDQGPIFPIGDRDLRLPVQAQILGVIATDGTPVAFPAAAARQRLEAAEGVELDGISLELDGSGLVAFENGEPIASHQAFWFAWSQFHPQTLLWEPSTG
jgi:hypothetical protein